MVPLQVPERVSGLLPSTLVRADWAQSTVEPLGFILVKKCPIYLSSRATMVLVSFLSGHLTDQRSLGYSFGEDDRKESNGPLLPTIIATPFHDHPNIERMYCGRTSCLAIGNSGMETLSMWSESIASSCLRPMAKAPNDLRWYSEEGSVGYKATAGAVWGTRSPDG